MNILVVDDDRFVLEGIRRGIDWDTMPFEKVYMVQSVKKAKEILGDVEIHVLASDIEMPHESGLDLLAWVNERGIQLQSIFLTSYAQFGYAQRALALGSFDYFLKPIEYDKLRSIILKAGEKAAQSMQRRQYQQYWLDNQKNLQDHFWKEILDGTLHGNLAGVLHKAAEAGLHYSQFDRFTLILVSLFYHPQSETWKESMREYAFQNVAYELFQFSVASLDSIVRVRQNQYLLVISSRGAEDTLTDRLQDRSEALITECTKHFDCDIRCMIAASAQIEACAVTGDQLIEAAEQTLSYKNQVLLLQKFSPCAAAYVPPSFEQVSILFEAGNQEGFSRYMEEYLGGIDQKHLLTGEMLKKLRYDMEQLIFSKLYEKQIQAHRLFSNTTAECLQQNSLRSADAMGRYLEYLFKTALDYGNFAKNDQSVAARLREYIDKNIGRSITRNTLSEEVFLNPDYLARLFKQKMGVSIANYLLERRMERGKYLLKATRKPVNTIAEELGYDNGSYFSKLFRKRYGCTPHAYREQQ